MPSPRFHLPAVVVIAMIATPVTAQHRPDWRTTLWPRSAVSTTSCTAAPNAWLDLRRNGDSYTAQASNPLAGPAQVRLIATGSVPLQAAPALPSTALLRPGQCIALAYLYPSKDTLQQGVDVHLEVVPGDPSGYADGSVYRVPFDTTPIRIDQGFGGLFSHQDDANYYALDFALPKGTPILAARAGLVMEVQTGFQEATANGRHAGGGNLVRILHEDGSMAVYAHLSPDGIAVHQGDRVTTGQCLGLSGNTGFSTAPHLHFAVQLNRNLHLVSVPFRMASPLGELRFPRKQ
ncbi:M23 family metallopeptidase [Xylella taiwanensis]|uniref:Peptidase n=1 Tax=Xylella taiwanensis TaxID=1444770 RepID=Z9JN06_9GAMM|nr:M23 family metallopeptidase [Xylella taiwanensis]AXI84449.1 peptidase [Xylella taiwanensis]EWS79393.1 peptidase [Xylella taiwanensis]MCD8455346.1 M23 family metallopeptidase [Xylella taiwanensis]MCD8457751.1 M23 family metallopeptidase [Xylella taiwanensis]MCD8459886.1 M23 family metallopeptidase [Xylella taiwanensis]